MEHLLVVEDEEAIRESLAELLRFYGFDVATARNGHEALASILRERPRFVLTDLQMPVMNGWELIAQLRADASTRGIPVCVISSFCDDVPGGVPFLEKPVDIRRLLSILELRAERAL